MDIKAKKIEVELNSQEARKIAYHIKYSIEKSIDRHFIHLQDTYGEGLDYVKRIFEEQERDSLNIMNKLIACESGESDKSLEKELWLYLDEAYNKKLTNP